MTTTDSRRLVITAYVDLSPAIFDSAFMRAVPMALEAAARRVDQRRTSAVTETTETGVVLHGGLDLLAGTDVHWTGTEGLTTLQIRVPWSTDDSVDGRKLVAANSFAQEFSAAVRSTA